MLGVGLGTLFHSVGPKIQTQAFRFGGKSLYLQSHLVILSAPWFFFFFLILLSQYSIPLEIIEIQIEIALTLSQKLSMQRLKVWLLASSRGVVAAACRKPLTCLDLYIVSGLLSPWREQWQSLCPVLFPCSSQLNLEVNCANFSFILFFITFENHKYFLLLFL